MQEAGMVPTEFHSIQTVFQQMEPELLESRIRYLIWRYQVSRSKRMAQSIIRHMEAYCHHPDLV
jgi:hypothetical protein